MQLFFAEDIESGYCTLNEEESHHCVKVLRKGVGDEISVTDGRGTLCRCRIVEPNAKNCGIEVVERMEEYGRRPFRLHIAVAPTKNTARMEWFVEKAVEMGVDEITPILRRQRRKLQPFLMPAEARPISTFVKRHVCLDVPPRRRDQFLSIHRRKFPFVNEKQFPRQTYAYIITRQTMCHRKAQ